MPVLRERMEAWVQRGSEVVVPAELETIRIWGFG